MSCSSAARAQVARARPSSAPSAARQLVAIRHVRSEWRYVHGDFASTIAGEGVGDLVAAARRRRRAARSSRLPAREVAARRASPRRRGRGGARRARRRAPGRTSRRGAARATRAGGVDAAGGVEDLDGLREAQDAAQQRDLLAAQPARLAAAVPVLVERPDRLGGASVEPEHARDLGAAVAARLHQRARHLALVLDRQQPLEPRAASPLGATVRTDHTNAGSFRDQSTRLDGALERRGRRRRTAPPSAPRWPSSRRP